MPLQSNMTELEILNYIFCENSNLEYNEQERNKNFYHCFKFHLPTEMYKDGKLKFSYNKGLTFISCLYNDILLFQIPNSDEEKIKFLCPADKEFIKSLSIPDSKRSSLVKKLKNYRKPYIEIDAEPETIIGLSLDHWQAIKSLYEKLIVK